MLLESIYSGGRLAVPRASAGLACAVALLSLTSIFSSDFRASVALIPGQTLLGSHLIWNVVTGMMVETSLPLVFFVVGFVVLFGSHAERLMGALQYGACLLFATFVPGTMISMGALFFYISTQREKFFYGETNGSLGLCAAIAVMLHESAPTTVIMGGLLASHLPLTLMVFACVCQFLLGVSHAASLAGLGLIAAWMYLRFFKIQEDGSWGDRRSDFEFATLFPEATRPVVRPLFNLLGAVLLRIPCLQPSAAPANGRKLEVVPSGASGDSAGPSAPVAADPVAERRRARALKALDQKLAEMSSKRGKGLATSGGATAPAPEKQEEGGVKGLSGSLSRDVEAP